MWTENALLVAAVRLGGSAAGAVLALVFMPPKTRAEFVTRLAFSFVSGLLWAEAVREFLKWPETIWMVVSSTSLTSMLSWWAMAAVVRGINKIKWPPGK